jgi:replication-associated recombination protein RarA
MRLSEKYRPQTLAEVIGQDKAVRILERLTSRSWGGRAYWLAGNSGTGKTTLAWVLARMQAHELYITETVGRQLTPNRLREMSDKWHYRPMYGSGYALIVNEAHGLTKPVIEILLDVLENLPDNVLVVFTTTRDGQDLFEEQLDSGPFASRCINITLASRGLCEPFAERAKAIAEREGLDGKTISDYIRLMKNCRNNLRMALQHIEAGAML